MRPFCRFICALLAALAASTAAVAGGGGDAASAPGHPGTRFTPEREVADSPVPVVQSGRLAVPSPAGPVEIPIAVSRDWTRPQADVTRAIVVIPGWPRRDLRSGEHAAKVAGTAADGALVITPQFLTAKDVAAHHLPASIARWRQNDWHQGRPSNDGAAISSFQVVDEIFRRLADRMIFPNLDTIVLAGHSAGGQFVQRYAVVGHGEAVLGHAPIHVRYVVANPSTYLYFTDARPDSSGAFVPFDARRCPSFERWNYGLGSGVPAYVSAEASVAELQADYLRRDVVYLLGTDDAVPDADGLDRSCGAEAQGATRYARGQAFAAYVRTLDPRTPHRVLEARGVAHSSYRIYSSACGLAALFDTAGCGSGAQ
ncbi:alpha/beta hydrolase [Burkholderia sp. Bp8963]|uniref:alpha/beta hydrolase n=1 Tax=Burkholderia sp. Bp8963 TaxID=2184547 RepID=UPI000F5B86B6|nr:alpha/beta hydrolase [Burkholderia sp. Bp8963]